MDPGAAGRHEHRGGGHRETASTAAGLTEDGPIIELPEEADEAPPPTDATPKRSPEEEELERLRTDLTRGLRAYRFAIAANTAIGGYGEIVYYQGLNPNGDDPDGVADLRRIILFVAHRFIDWIRFYAELEVEHALAGADLPGYAGFEQATLEFLLSDALNVRLGMILMPMGFINQWHEPTVFHGVDRPAVERNVIPSTWREGGVGLFGSLAEGLDYELYLVTGLNPLGFAQPRAGGWPPGLRVRARVVACDHGASRVRTDPRHRVGSGRLLRPRRPQRTSTRGRRGAATSARTSWPRIRTTISRRSLAPSAS